MGQSLELDAGELPTAQHNIHIVLNHLNHKLVEYYNKHYGGFDHYEHDGAIVLVLYVAIRDHDHGPDDHYHVRRGAEADYYVEHNHAWGGQYHTHAPGGTAFTFPAGDGTIGGQGYSRNRVDGFWRWRPGRAPRTEAP